LRKLVIHAGFHKTGTTALQHSLSASESALRSQGWNYPVLSHGNSQSDSALALAKRGWGWKGGGSKPIPMKTWDRLVARINRDSGNSVISSEFFSELKLADIEKIKTAFPKHEVKVVFSIRALDALFPSNFQQALKGGSDLGYEDWLERILADYQNGRRSSFWRRNQHALVIERWAGVFGNENITLITSDVQNQSALYERFETLLGLKPDSLVRESGSGLNRGLLLDEISLILEVNRSYPKNARWNEYQTFIKQGVIDKFTSTPAGTVQETNRLRTPAKFAKQINEIAKIELALLRDLDVDVLGSFDELEPGSLLVGQNSEVKDIDLAKVAAVLARQNYDAVSTIAPRSLVKNWLPYLEHRIPDSSFRFLMRLRGKLTGRS
jgi:hypothetical protein